MSIPIHPRTDRPPRPDAPPAFSPSRDLADDSLFAGWQREAIEAYRRYLADASGDRFGQERRDAVGRRAEGTPVALVRSMYDAFRRRDAAAVLALMSPAIEIVQSELLPWGGRHVGHAGAQEFFGTLLRHIDSEVEMRTFVDAGERVVAVGRTRGIALDTRRAFDVNAVHVWTVVDGRATRLEAFIDTPAMLAAIR